MATVKEGQLSYYLTIDEFGVYAHDSKTDEELVAVSHNDDLDSAIKNAMMSIPDGRLVGARFVA